MPKVKLDPEREHRITYEIVVDCYDEYEVASGWYHYFLDQLGFPFQAKFSVKDASSGFDFGDVVKVIGLADQEDCEDGIYVLIEFVDEDAELDVPLEELTCITGTPQTRTAVEDWSYAVAQGYGFSLSSDEE